MKINIGYSVIDNTEEDATHSFFKKVPENQDKYNEGLPRSW
jgi:hypothetical protein